MGEHREPPTKQSIVYTVETRDGGFIASVTCDRFLNSYVLDDIQATPQLAEQEAAKLALAGEFPNYSVAEGQEAGGPRPKKKAKYESMEEKVSWLPKSRPNLKFGELDPKSKLNE